LAFLEIRWISWVPDQVYFLLKESLSCGWLVSSPLTEPVYIWC
jgi:hypothetical protein